MISPLTIQRFNEGDERSFREIFDELFGELHYFVARSFSKITREDREEVISSVFFNLWKTKGTFEAEINIRAFCFTCVKNFSLNKIRDEQTHSGNRDNFITECQAPEPDKIEYENYSFLIKLISSLPKQRKRIMELTIEGFDNIEIAKIMNLSHQTVKNHKKFARQSLRELLKCG